MPKTVLSSVAELEGLIGQEVYVSDWVTITQGRIDQFAEATGDHQWIHVDPERARVESPLGVTIAHGYLTLSLLALFRAQALELKDRTSGINYGLNKVRFLAPVKVNSRLRGRGTVLAYERTADGARVTFDATVEIEGQAKPACVAETIGLMQFKS